MEPIADVEDGDVHVRIVGTIVIEGVTFYDIAVNADGGKWRLQRRYNHFVELDRRLRASGVRPPCKLPPKGWLGIHRCFNVGNFNARRQAGLSLYLCGLLKQVRSQNLTLFLASQGVSALPSADEPPAWSTKGPQVPLLQLGDLPPIEAASASTAPGQQGSAASSSTHGISRTPSGISRIPSGISRYPSAAWSGKTLGKVECCCGPDTLTGAEWAAFRASRPALAETVRTCAELMANSRRLENENEEVFAALRRGILASRRCLEELEGRRVVWNFLLLIASRRPFYRNRAAEVARILESSEAWAHALDDYPELLAVKEELLTA